MVSASVYIRRRVLAKLKDEKVSYESICSSESIFPARRNFMMRNIPRVPSQSHPFPGMDNLKTQFSLVPPRSLSLSIVEAFVAFQRLRVSLYEILFPYKYPQITT